MTYVPMTDCNAIVDEYSKEHFCKTCSDSIVDYVYWDEAHEPIAIYGHDPFRELDRVPGRSAPDMDGFF